MSLEGTLRPLGYDAFAESFCCCRLCCHLALTSWRTWQDSTVGSHVWVNMLLFPQGKGEGFYSVNAPCSSNLRGICLGPWPSPSDTHLTGCLFLLVFSHWCAAIRQSAPFAGGAGGGKIYADTMYAIMKTEDKTLGYHTNWCIFAGRLFAWSSNSCHAPASLIWAPLPLQHPSRSFESAFFPSFMQLAPDATAKQAVAWDANRRQHDWLS